MAPKLRRNTGPATNEAARKRRKQQDLVRELIRTNIFSWNCSCGRCENGDYSDLCISYGNIAKLANQRNIPSVTGLRGKWQTVQAVRLFPDSRHKYSTSSSDAKGDDAIVNNEEKSSLDGLI